MKLLELRAQLDELNYALAERTCQPPASFSFQTGESNQDTLYLYGILGGKDVGKTTLINRLAGDRISIDTDLLDEGTRTLTAYCHDADSLLLKRRFGLDDLRDIQFKAHHRDELKNVVLIDFPDFDSRFVEHLEHVHRFAPHLQGIVWITTPRKYADHELFDQLERVAQSHENYFVVLNKVDQLDGRATLDEIETEVLSTLNRACERRGIPLISKDRFFMFSAQRPERYQYDAFYNRLIRPHSVEEIARAKAQNLQAEFDRNILKLRSHFAIDERLSEIDAALDCIQEAVEREFSEDYLDTVRRRVLTLEPVQRRISAGVFNERIDHWPILRSLFYPLSGLVSLLGGRLAFRSRGDEWLESPRDLLRYQGESASNRLQRIQDRIEMERLFAFQTTTRNGDFRDEVERQFTRVLAIYEERVARRLTTGLRPPGPMKRTAVFLPLIWFPFVQPLLLHFMRGENRLLSLGGLWELMGVSIALLGAGALLESLVFLVIFYFIWLMFLYAKGTRRILRAGEDEMTLVWREEFISWVMERLSEPLVRERSEWVELNLTLERIGEAAQREIASLAKPAA